MYNEKELMYTSHKEENDLNKAPQENSYSYINKETSCPNHITSQYKRGQRDKLLYAYTLRSSVHGRVYMHKPFVECTCINPSFLIGFKTFRFASGFEKPLRNSW